MTDATWDGAGDGVTWESDANWGGTEYPQFANDVATIDATADAIVTSGALTIGALLQTTGFTGSLTLGGTLTVDDSGTETGSFDLDAGTFDANDFDINIDGNAVLDGSTVTMGAGSIWTVNGNWDSNSSITVNEETSTVRMTGTSVTINGGTSSARQLATVEIATGATVSTAGSFRPATLTVNGTLTLNSGNRAQVTSVITIGSSGSATGAGELRLSGGGTISVGSGTIDTAILRLEGNATINPGTYDSATVNAAPSSSGARTITFASGTFVFRISISVSSSGKSI